MAAHPIHEPSPSYGAPSHKPSYGGGSHGGGGHGGHGGRRPSYGGGGGGGGGLSSLFSSPLLFLLVPLVLLLIAVPVITAFGSNNTGGIGGRSSGITAAEKLFRSFVDKPGFLSLERFSMALESEECMNRMICELGVRATHLPQKEMIFR